MAKPMKETPAKKATPKKSLRNRGYSNDAETGTDKSGSDSNSKLPRIDTQNQHGRSAKPSRSCNPRLAWFDSGAAP